MVGGAPVALEPMCEGRGGERREREMLVSAAGELVKELVFALLSGGQG